MASTDAAARTGPGLLRQIWAVPEVGVLLPLAAFALLFYAREQAFLSPNNLGAMLRALAFIGVVAVGQTFLMIAGEIDLSVGSVAGLCAVASSWLMKNKGFPLEAGLVTGLLLGALVGTQEGARRG